MTDVDTLARAAYDAYGDHTGHLNYQGLPMPIFDDLGDTIQGAWRKAAARVDEMVRRELADAHRDDVVPGSGVPVAPKAFPSYGSGSVSAGQNPAVVLWNNEGA